MKKTQFLTDLSLEEFKALTVRLGGRPFHGKMLHSWIFQQGAGSIEEMTDLPKTLRKALTEAFTLHRLEKIQEAKSSDGTLKTLYRLPDGHCIETVRIPDGDRTTLCVSTQVGCAVACRFCASGMKGLVRNLTSGEIVEQVLLSGGAGRRDLTNIVFMGIGEPLMNFKNLSGAIRFLNQPEGMAFGARRITVSTMGIPEGIRKLADMELQINLAISLHAADPSLRGELIPPAKQIALQEVLEAADYYRHKTTRDVTFEVLLLRGVNDSEEDARKLTALLGSRKCSVNLIPYNPVKGVPFDAPGAQRVSAFRRILEEGRIPVTVRRPRGVDIQSACGQLRLKAEEGADARRPPE